MCKIETKTDEYPHSRTTRATTTTRRCSHSKDRQPCRRTRVINLGRTVHRTSSSEVSSGNSKMYTVKSPVISNGAGARMREPDRVQVRSPKSQKTIFGFRMPFSKRRGSGEEDYRGYKRSSHDDRREDIKYEYRVPRQPAHEIRSVSPRGYPPRVPDKREEPKRDVGFGPGSGPHRSGGRSVYRSPREPTQGPKRVRFKSQLVIPLPVELHHHKPLSARGHTQDAERRDRHKSPVRENIQVNTARPRMHREEVTPVSAGADSGRRMSYVRSSSTGTPAVPRQTDESRPRPRIIQERYRQMADSSARVLGADRDRPFVHESMGSRAYRPEYARVVNAGSARERDGFGSERRYGSRWR